MYAAGRSVVTYILDMGFFELILLAVGLAMDAFAVSICKGLAAGKATLKEYLLCGIWFGSFQGMMPLLGYLVGSRFERLISMIAPWTAFLLLSLIGINMLKEAFEKSECEECGCGDLSPKKMFVMAVATSIDALAVGISLAMAGDVNIFVAMALIGVVTFVMSAAGVKVGNVFGSRFEKKAQLAGGLILILIGLKILLEHLGILA